MHQSFRECQYCQKSFAVKARAPHQRVCGQEQCQRKRKTDYHRQKLKADPTYKETCRDSSRKWRSANPGYLRKYRAEHPEQMVQNRLGQQRRDQRRTASHLENNNSVMVASGCQSELYVIRGPGADLEKNNSVGQLTHSRGEIYLVVPAGARLERNNSVAKVSRGG
jgi:hypothetical protein